MASSISLSRPNLINTPLEEGGEFSVWIFCIVAPISSYEALSVQQKILQLDSGPGEYIRGQINQFDSRFSTHL
jgi:hypothetical protein